MYKLRELQYEDITILNNWRNNKELIDYLGAPFRYINIDVDKKWYENYMSSRNTTIRCAIVDEVKQDSVLGLVSLTNLDYINRNAIFHIMIGEMSQRGKGIGYFATTEILRHAFNDLNLKRIELSVFEDNERAVNLYKRVGFKCEGVKRQAVYKNGHFLDMLIMGILKEDILEWRV